MIVQFHFELFYLFPSAIRLFRTPGPMAFCPQIGWSGLHTLIIVFMESKPYAVH